MRLGVNRRHEPWFALGDFNELISNQEKIGGRVHSEASFHEFRTMMRVCEFSDLQSVGDRFSWAGQRGNHLVRCCLDRTMANGTWFDLFPVCIWSIQRLVNQIIIQWLLSYQQKEKYPVGYSDMITECFIKMASKIQYVEDGVVWVKLSCSDTFNSKNQSMQTTNFAMEETQQKQCRGKDWKLNE